MKQTCFSISTLLFLATLLLTKGSFAQDYVYYSTLGDEWHHIKGFALSPDGQMIASSAAIWSLDEQITVSSKLQLWDATTGQQIRTLTRYANINTGDYGIRFSPDGKTIATGGSDKTIRLWDTATGKLKNTLIGHTGRVTSVSFRPDGIILASGSSDKTIRLWDVSTGLLRQTLLGHTEGVNDVCFSPDGQILATVGTGNVKGEVWLWDATGEYRIIPVGPSPPLRVSFSPDGKTLAIAIHRDNRVHLWNITSNEYRPPLTTKHSSGVFDVCFSPDGQTLATVGFDLVTLEDMLCLWDPMSGEHKRTLTTGKRGLYEVHFSHDGRTLAGVKHSTVHLWRLASVAPVEATPLIPLKSTADQVYNNAIRAVMWIMNPGIGEGSGVLIDKQSKLAITNAHVTGTQNTIDIYFPAPDEKGELIKDRNFYLTSKDVLKRLGYYTKGHVVARSEKTDLAIIRLDGLPESAREIDWNLTPPATTAVDLVYILGNPAKHDLWRWTLGEFLNDHGDFLHIQSDVFGGNSGGPVLNKQGILIGIVARSDRHMNALAIPVRDINRLLSESGLEHSRSRK